MDTQRTDAPHPDTSTPAELELRAAAVVLGISTEALRKRIARGTIPARKIAGVWMVTLDPSATGRTDTRTLSGMSPGHATVRPRSSTPAIDPSDYARAQERITGLEAQLAQAHADRDRWHAQATAAQEQYLHDMAAMRELVAREQAIALRATTSPDGWTDNGRTDADVTAGEDVTLQEPRAGNDDPDTLSVSTLRRWWRRLTGGDETDP